MIPLLAHAVFNVNIVMHHWVPPTGPKSQGRAASSGFALAQHTDAQPYSHIDLARKLAQQASLMFVEVIKFR